MHCCSVVAVQQFSYAVHNMQCGRCELATGLMCICICVFIFVFLCICICVFVCLYFAVDQSSYAVHARFGRCEQETGPRACLRRRLVVGSDNGKVRNPRGST